MLTFAGRVARAADCDTERAIRAGDVRRAEKVLAGLRLLHEAAGAGDAGAYRKLTSKLYPDLFIKVAEVRDCDLSTDLSTAVFLAEKLGRTWAAAGEEAADCLGERPDIYRPLCLDLRGGTARQLLLAKSRLHARWAEALLRNNRGEAGAETARTLAEAEAARENDLLIAARVLETLKAVERRFPLSTADADRGQRFEALTAAVDRPSVEIADALRAAEALLAWMPRSPTFYQLSNALLGYADGLSWYGKVRQSKKLVVSANSFAPGPLKELGLNVEQAGAAVEANRQSAVRYTRLAEQSLTKAAR
ncbi:MAG: hypothetical protein JOZ02_05455 [Acidobacteria bacterium]|nr:hypothetical protein [Acidobacteriota bacterium]